MAGQIFIVVATKGADRIRQAVEMLPSDNYFEVKHDTWFVLSDGTTRKLAEDLGIRTGANGSGLVAPINGYSGRASADMWEWLKAKWPEDG